MKARLPVKPITLLGLMNVIVSKLLLLIVVSLFLPHVQEQLSESPGNSRWFKLLPGLVSESDALAFYSMSARDILDDTNNPGLSPSTPQPTPATPHLANDGQKEQEAQETRRKLLLMASVIVFDIVLSTCLTLSLAKNWFCGIWPWIVFRFVLACGLLASAFAVIIQNLTMRLGGEPRWDFCNVLSIMATIIFANVYIVYSYYWKKTKYSGPPLLPMSSSSGPGLLPTHAAPSSLHHRHHPMYSSIDQGSEETTITMELDDIVSLEQREAAEIMDHKAGLASKYSSFWENQSPGLLTSKLDPNATL